MLKERKFIQISSYFVVLLPIFLITGPFLSDATVTLVALTFLILCTKNRDFVYFNNYFFKIILIFYFYLVLNSFFNFNNFNSFKASVTFIRFPIFIIAFIFLLENNKKLFHQFFFSLLFSFVILLIDSSYQYLNGKNLLGFVSFNNYRLSSFFGDELILGSYLARLIPILFGLSLIVFNNSKKIIIYLSVIFILSEVIIFLSGERTAFFLLNFSAVFMIIMLKELKIYRLCIIAISFVLIFLLSIHNSSSAKRIFVKTYEQFAFNEVTKSLNEDYKIKIFGIKIYLFSKQHTHHYLSSLRMYKENKVFGVGLKNFRVFCNEEKYKISDISCSTHPHNTYVQFLSELGIMGLLFLLWSLFLLLYFSAKHLLLKIRNEILFSDFEICMIATIWIYLWPFMPTGNFFNNWLMVIICIPLSFLLWSRKVNAKI